MRDGRRVLILGPLPLVARYANVERCLALAGWASSCRTPGTKEVPDLGMKMRRDIAHKMFTRKRYVKGGYYATPPKTTDWY